MKEIVVGVSGKIGSGKTTFCNFLKRKTFHINTDEIVHKLYRKEQKGAKLARRIFGKNYLDKNGDVDRKKLRSYFLSGHNKFKLFLFKLYPFVIFEINQIIKNSKRKIVLLEFIDFDIETFRCLIDCLLYIECSENLILKRYSRKFSKEYLKRVFKVQKKPKNIDFVIKNDLTKTDLKNRAEKFMNNLKCDIFGV